MQYFSAADLADLVAPTKLVAALEQGLVEYAAGEVSVPDRQHVDFGSGVLLSMPAAGRAAFGAKIVSVVPSNAMRGMPIVNGLMVLCDGPTGVPLAIMNAAALTAQRTGALGAIGIKYTTPSEIDSVGIIGVGVQGTWQAIFASFVRPIRTVYYIARLEDRARTFEQTVQRHVPELRLHRCQDAAELLTGTQVIIAATTSDTPILPSDAALLLGKHGISIGSYRPSMQEFPDELYRLARCIVIDSDAARTEVGDVSGPLSRQVVNSEDIFHIADLIVGRRSIDVTGTTVFKSVGSALYDLYAARAIYAEAQISGRGVTLAP